MAVRILALHGFTQNRRCWGPFGERLGAAGDVRVVDVAGHGSASGLEVDLWGGADAIATELVAPSVVVGYSMGGRFALHLALSHRELVRALVLIGANPGITDRDARAERRRRDHDLAAHLEAIGVDAFCEEWLAMPMFAGLGPSARFLDERRTNTVAGLSSSLRLAGTGSQDDLWPRLAELDQIPVLALAGADDHAYGDIVERMGRAHRFVDARRVDGAGHAAHLERPGATAQVVVDWLSSSM